jgi:hypothetical protein
VGPLLAAIFGSGVQIESGKPQRGPQIGEALVSILLYGFGNFAVYRYSALGLRIVCYFFQDFKQLKKSIFSFSG